MLCSTKSGRLLSILCALMLLFLQAAQAQQVLPADPIRTLQQKAESSYLAGDYNGAIRQMEDAIALARKQNSLPRVADLQVESSTIYFVSGSTDKAISACKSALDLLNKTPVDSIRFKAVSNLGYFYTESFQEKQADFYYGQADNLLESKQGLVKQTPGYVAAYYNQRGTYYNNTYDFIQATTYFEKAVNVAKEYDLTSLLSFFTNNLSTQYDYLGDYQKSLRLGLETLENTKEPFRKISYLINVAQTYAKLHRYDEARGFLKQAQQLISVYKSRSSGDFAESEITLWRNWGLYYTDTHRPEQGINAFDKAIRLSSNYWGEHHPTLAVSYRDKARLLEENGRYEAALENYRHAMSAVYLGAPLGKGTSLPDLNEGILSDRELFEALLGQASVLEKIGLQRRKPFLEETFATYQLALHLAERIRTNYDVADAKLLFGQQVSAVNEQALRIAYELYAETHQYRYLKKAFEITESTRASTLFDARKEQSLKSAWVPRDLSMQESQIKGEITSLKLQLQQPLSKEEQANLKAKLVEQKLALDKFRQKLRQRIPMYARYRAANETLGVDDLRTKVLDDKSAVLSYVLTDQDVFIFVVTKGAVKWLRRPMNEHIRGIIQKLQVSLYENPGISPYKGHQAAQFAYQYLFAPVLPYLRGVDRLIIIRDKELNYLPFEVLESDASSHGFLLRDYAIRYAYGASLAQIHSPPPSWGGGPSGVLAMAPFSDLSVQKNTFRDKTLGTLPASQKEIMAVGGIQFANNKATKDQFLKSYASSEIIHLATHARTDDKDAERSFIAFYPDNSQYKLYTDELYNLSFSHTRMVVLSACETGRGRLHRGEGLMSLARGFLYGGCPSVVTTLWNAHDQSSAYLSERLYYHLRKGDSIDEALRQAKLDFFSSKMGVLYDHPYYWANMILIGDASVLYQSKWKSIGRISLGICLIGSLFLGITLARYWFRE